MSSYFHFFFDRVPFQKILFLSTAKIEFFLWQGNFSPLILDILNFSNQCFGCPPHTSIPNIIFYLKTELAYCALKPVGKYFATVFRVHTLFLRAGIRTFFTFGSQDKVSEKVFPKIVISGLCLTTFLLRVIWKLFFFNFVLRNDHDLQLFGVQMLLVWFHVFMYFVQCALDCFHHILIFFWFRSQKNIIDKSFGICFLTFSHLSRSTYLLTVLVEQVR